MTTERVVCGTAAHPAATGCTDAECWCWESDGPDTCLNAEGIEAPETPTPRPEDKWRYSLRHKRGA